MSNLVHLTKILTISLFNKKAFLYSLVILIIISLFVIPNKDSSYITFHIDNYSGEYNSIWVSSLGAIYSNLILSFVGFFLIEGSYSKEVNRGLGNIVKTTISSNRVLLLHKWLSYILVLYSFLVLIIISLYIINFNSFNFLTFLYPFIYFNTTYVFLLASFILILDVFIYYRALKITFFLFLILFLVSPLVSDNYDLLGFNEFSEVINKQFSQKYNITNNFYSIGFIKRTQNTTYLILDNINWLSNFFIKAIYIPTSIFTIFIFSFFFNRYSLKRRKVFFKGKKISHHIATINFSYNVSIKKYYLLIPEIKKTFSSILSLYLILFKKSFTNFQLVLLTILWVISFFTSYKISSNIIIPFIFMLSFNIYDRFVNVENKELSNFSFITSCYSLYERLIIKVLILFIFFMICLVPILVLKSIESNLSTIVYFLFFSILSVITSYLLKSVKLLEVIYIMIFASYISGYPILKIL